MGVELTVKLAFGLIKAIPNLLRAIPQIISSMTSGFREYYSNLGEVGKNLIRGVANGILDMGSWLREKVSGFFGGVVDNIKSFFGIHSPSTLFKNEIGKNLALGIGEGFGDTMADVSADMQGAIPTEFDTSVKMNASSSSYSSNYDYLVTAFKEALKDVKVVMNNREMGAFIVNTVEREVYA
jgi:phage-related protein